MSNGGISVIVACYHPDFEKLKETITSIFKQKDVVYEIVVADDGSKTEYRSALEKWLDEIEKKEIVRFSFLDENGGTVKNILSASYVATLPYVKVISPGDYLYDEFTLKTYLEMFDANGADLVFGKAQYVTADGRLLPRTSPANPKVYQNKQLKQSVLFYGDYILGAAIAVRRDLLIEYLEKINGKVRFLEDVPLTFFSILDGKKVFATDKKVVWYEYGEGISTSVKRTSMLYPDYEATYKMIADYATKDAKKAIRFYRAGKIRNKWVRILRKCLIPGYAFFKLRATCSKKQTDDLRKMYEMIK